MILPFRIFVIRVVVNIKWPDSFLGRIVVFIQKEITFRRQVSAFYGGEWGGVPGMGVQD